jgi:ATP-dependent 26S proteasome regulatory subunit
LRILPREVDPAVHAMLTEDPGEITFGEIGGLGDQIRVLREVNKEIKIFLDKILSNFKKIDD